MNERKLYQWVERFQDGRISFVDEHRSGRPCTADSDANVAHVDAFNGENRRISVETVATVLNISVEPAHGIIHGTLKRCCTQVIAETFDGEHKFKFVLNVQSFLDTLPC
jgi:hypothetical protein